MGLLSAHQTLEIELERVTEERAKVTEALEESKLQLAKTRIATHTMEKKNKVWHITTHVLVYIRMQLYRLLV